MQNFIFSINATMPVFFVIVVGYLLRRGKMLNEPFVNVANRFNFNVTLPLLLVKDISSADIRRVWDGKYVLFCAVVTTICFFAIWAGAKWFIKDKTIIGAFVQSSFRGSAAVLGIAFIQNMYGNSGMAPLMMIGSVPLYNIYSVLVLTFEADDSGSVLNKKQKIKDAFVNILKNPIIWGILIGLFLSYYQIVFPVLINKTLVSIASMASPLALICIGAGFEGRAALAKIKPTLVASFIKLFLQAAVFIPLAVYIGFRQEKLIALLIMLAAPTTPSCYIMAKQMQNDGVLTASVVVATTGIAAISLTFFIYLLKSFQLI